MNIPIVKWTNPMTKEVFTDKVLIPFKKVSQRFLCPRFFAPTSWMRSRRTSLRGSKTLMMTQCMLRTYRFCIAHRRYIYYIEVLFKRPKKILHISNMPRRRNFFWEECTDLGAFCLQLRTISSQDIRRL